MTDIKSRWAATLFGDLYDLSVIKKALAPPGDPWTEQGSSQETLLIRSTSWNDIDDAHVVHNALSVLVDRLNGGLQLATNDPQPIRLGNILEFKRDGTNDTRIFPQGLELKLAMGRVLPEIDGEAKPVIHGNLRKLLNIAETNETLSDLLEHLKRADNWFDLYKVTEKLHDLAGNEHKWIERLGAEALTWKNCKRAINLHRHSRGHAGAPLNPMPDFNAVKQQILHFARRVENLI